MTEIEKKLSSEDSKKFSIENREFDVETSIEWKTQRGIWLDCRALEKFEAKKITDEATIKGYKKKDDLMQKHLGLWKVTSEGFKVNVYKKREVVGTRYIAQEEKILISGN